MHRVGNFLAAKMVLPLNWRNSLKHKLKSIVNPLLDSRLRLCWDNTIQFPTTVGTGKNASRTVRTPHPPEVCALWSAHCLRSATRRTYMPQKFDHSKKMNNTFSVNFLAKWNLSFSYFNAHYKSLFVLHKYKYWVHIWCLWIKLYLD